MKIQLLIYDGFDELDAIAPFEVLRLERYWGSAIALSVEQTMEYQRRGTVWRKLAEA